jgi:hypothetical protein
MKTKGLMNAASALPTSNALTAAVDFAAIRRVLHGEVPGAPAWATERCSSRTARLRVSREPASQPLKHLNLDIAPDGTHDPHTHADRLFSAQIGSP